MDQRILAFEGCVFIEIVAGSKTSSVFTLSNWKVLVYLNLMPGFSGLWRYFDGKHLPNGENIYWDFAGIYEVHKMVVNCRAFAHNIRWTDSWKNRLHLWKHVRTFASGWERLFSNELTKQNLGGGVNFLKISPLLGVKWSNLMPFKPPPRKYHGSGFSILKTDRTFKWVWYRRHGTPMGFDPPKSPLMSYRYHPLGFDILIETNGTDVL